VHEQAEPCTVAISGREDRKKVTAGRSQPGSRPLPIIRCPRLGRQKRPRVEERVMASVPLRQDVSRLRPVGERRGYRVPDS